MEKQIRGFALGQMRLMIISPENPEEEVQKLMEMGCTIKSADSNHIEAKFLKGADDPNGTLKKMLDDGWKFYRPE